jgi:hypothetical protein
MVAHFLQSHGCVGSSSSLPDHVGRTNVADEWARSPPTVNEVPRSPDDEEVKELSMLRTITCVSLEWLSPHAASISHMVYIAGHGHWTPYPAISILSESELQRPFLASDLETCPTLLLVMSRDGDHSQRPWIEGPSHGGQLPPSHWVRTDTGPD